MTAAGQALDLVMGHVGVRKNSGLVFAGPGPEHGGPPKLGPRLRAGLLR